MDFKIPKFDELKGRLGIGEASGQAGSRPSRGRDSRDDAVDYGDYGEYGFDDSADYAVGNESSSSSFTASLPKLVTSDDVRANIQYTPSEAPETADASQATRPNRDFGALREDSHRSPGVNSLFEPSSAASAPQATASSTGAYAQTTGSIPAPASSSSEGRVVQRPARIVTIVKPESYDDAERIAKVLKSGDVAVVSLRNTPEALGKRILDFSFGVACAFEAQVECVSGHVFVITRGAGLSDAEASRLKAQGLM